MNFLSRPTTRAIGLVTAMVYLATSSGLADAGPSLWNDRRRLGAAHRTVGSENRPGGDLAMGTARLSDATSLFRRWKAQDRRLLPILEALSGPEGSVRSIDPAAGGGAPLVVAIEDVHANPEAQRHIESALSDLLSSVPVAFVGLEGAFRSLTLSPFRKLDRSVVSTVAGFLLNDRRMSGPAHLALTFPGPVPPFIGIDDAALHRANVDAYRASREVPAAAGDLARWRDTVLSRSTRVNAALLRFEQEEDDYDGGRLSLVEFARQLIARAPRRWPALERFVAAADSERALDPDRLRGERLDLLRRLNERSNAAVMSALAAQAEAVASGQLDAAAFDRALLGAAASAGLADDAPTLKRHAGTAASSEGIDEQDLLRALDEARRSAGAALAHDAFERAALRQRRVAALAGKLLRFALSAREWNDYRALSASESDPGWSRLERELTPFSTFYAAAERRDAAMADRLLIEMRAHPTGAAVVVLGGFHVDGLRQRMRERGINLVIWSPRFHPTSGDPSAYLSAFTRATTPLERTCEVVPGFLASAPLPFVDVIGGVIGETALSQSPATSRVAETIRSLSQDTGISASVEMRGDRTRRVRLARGGAASVEEVAHDGGGRLSEIRELSAEAPPVPEGGRRSRWAVSRPSIEAAVRAALIRCGSGLFLDFVLIVAAGSTRPRGWAMWAFGALLVFVGAVPVFINKHGPGERETVAEYVQSLDEQLNALPSDQARAEKLVEWISRGESLRLNDALERARLTSTLAERKAWALAWFSRLRLYEFVNDPDADRDERLETIGRAYDDWSAPVRAVVVDTVFAPAERWITYISFNEYQALGTWGRYYSTAANNEFTQYDPEAPLRPAPGGVRIYPLIYRGPRWLHELQTEGSSRGKSHWWGLPRRGWERLPNDVDHVGARAFLLAAAEKANTLAELELRFIDLEESRRRIDQLAAKGVIPAEEINGFHRIFDQLVELQYDEQRARSARDRRRSSSESAFGGTLDKRAWRTKFTRDKRRRILRDILMNQYRAAAEQSVDGRRRSLTAGPGASGIVPPPGPVASRVSFPSYRVPPDHASTWINPVPPDRRERDPILTREAFDRAFAVLKSAVVRTPLIELPNLSRLVGKRVFLKDESQQEGESFKARGVYYEVWLTLDSVLGIPEVAKMWMEGGMWIGTQSTGNHGIAVFRSVTRIVSQLLDKYAADPDMTALIRGIQPFVFTLRNLPAIKRRSMTAALDDFRRVHGRTKGFIRDDFEDYAEALRARQTFIAQNDPRAFYMDHGGRPIMMGHGSAGLEIAEQLREAGVDPEANVVLIDPVGAGGPIGIAASLKFARPRSSAVIVQSDRYDALVRTLQTGTLQQNAKDIPPTLIVRTAGGSKRLVFPDGIAVDGPEGDAADFARLFADAAVSVDERAALLRSAPLLYRDVAAYYGDLKKVRVGGTTALTAETLLTHYKDLPVIRSADAVVLFGTEGNIDEDVLALEQELAFNDPYVGRLTASFTATSGLTFWFTKHVFNPAFAPILPGWVGRPHATDRELERVAMHNVAWWFEPLVTGIVFAVTLVALAHAAPGVTALNNAVGWIMTVAVAGLASNLVFALIHWNGVYEVDGRGPPQFRRFSELPRPGRARAAALSKLFVAGLVFHAPLFASIAFVPLLSRGGSPIAAVAGALGIAAAGLWMAESHRDYNAYVVGRDVVGWLRLLAAWLSPALRSLLRGAGLAIGRGRIAALGRLLGFAGASAGWLHRFVVGGSGGRTVPSRAGGAGRSAESNRSDLLPPISRAQRLYFRTEREINRAA